MYHLLFSIAIILRPDAKVPLQGRSRSFEANNNHESFSFLATHIKVYLHLVLQNPQHNFFFRYLCFDFLSTINHVAKYILAVNVWLSKVNSQVQKNLELYRRSKLLALAHQKHDFARWLCSASSSGIILPLNLSSCFAPTSLVVHSIILDVYLYYFTTCLSHKISVKSYTNVTLWAKPIRWIDLQY